MSHGKGIGCVRETHRVGENGYNKNAEGAVRQSKRWEQEKTGGQQGGRGQLVNKRGRGWTKKGGGGTSGGRNGGKKEEGGETEGARVRRGGEEKERVGAQERGRGEILRRVEM